MDKRDINSRMGKDETERPESHINASTTVSALPNPGRLSGISVRIVGFFVLYVPFLSLKFTFFFSILLRT